MKPKLFESLLQSNLEFRQLMEDLKHKATAHPFLKRYCEVGVKERLFSDMASALGRMHDTLVEAANPEMIGRDIITVRPTTETMERFPLDEKAIAYRYAEGAFTRLSGKKISTVDVYTNIIAEASEEWTREFLEDATWNVMDSMTEKVGRALGETETNKILDLYAAIANADLAGGAPIDNADAALNWSGLLKLHNAVRGENWRPTVLALNEIQLHQLLSDDKFIHAQYLPAEQVDLERGVIGSVLGMKVMASTLVPNGTAYAIDTRVAAVMLLRRDVTIEDWEDPKTGEFGVRATTRFGLGVLRSKAVAKMTNISTITRSGWSEMSKFEGKCPECGKIHHSNRKDDIVVCDCWRYCPLCGAEMTSHTPDLTPNVYGIDGKRDFDVLMVCTLHSPPFYSTQKPVEVVCT